MKQTNARFVHWAAYGVTLSLVALPFTVLGILAGDHCRPYVTGSGFGLAAVLAAPGAKYAVKLIGGNDQFE